jgi:hypothetical protein
LRFLLGLPSNLEGLLRENEPSRGLRFFLGTPSNLSKVFVSPPSILEGLCLCGIKGLNTIEALLGPLLQTWKGHRILRPKQPLRLFLHPSLKPGKAAGMKA